MRLSEKGENRLYNSKNVFYDDDIEGDVVALWELSKVWEFEPDDFTGAVILTIEEAKAVNEAIEWLCSTLEDYEREHDNTPALIEGWNQMNFLEHRIEQAEKKK